MARVYMLNCCLCSQWLPVWSPFLLALRFRQDGNQSLRWPPEKSECWLYGPVLSFSPHKEGGESGRFPPNHMMLCRRGWWGKGSGEVRGVGRRHYGERVSQIFLLSSMWLVLHAPGIQVLLNWFLDFSQVELVHMLWKCVSMEAEKV